MAEMLVKCTVCGREERPDHGRSLEAGWPKCCGYTMRLETNKEFIAAIESEGLPDGCLDMGPSDEPEPPLKPHLPLDGR